MGCSEVLLGRQWHTNRLSLGELIGLRGVIKYDCGRQSLKGYGLVYGSGDGSRDLEDYGIRDHHLL